MRAAGGRADGRAVPLLLVVQWARPCSSHPGPLTHAPPCSTFLRAAASCPSLPLAGSGYGLLQLAWQGEAQAVGEDGVLTPQPVSALSWMEARGIT